MILTDPVLRSLEGYKQAVYEKNLHAFEALYDENITVFDMWGSDWKFQGINAWVEMAREWFSSLENERVVVDFEDVQVRQTSEMAFISTYVKFTAVSAEGVTLRSLQNRMTRILEKKSGSWLITHEHTSCPVDHQTLKISLSKT